MANPNKAKGTKWESDVVGFLRAHRVYAFKPRQAGFRDVGDIHAGPAVLQAKDWGSWQDAIREGLDGAIVQAANRDATVAESGIAAPPSLPAAVVKRARRPVGDAYVVMRLSDFVGFLRDLTARTY